MFCALTVSVMAVPLVHDYSLHERRGSVPKAWTEGQKLDGNVSLPVRIGLTQSNLDYGHELLMNLYEPKHFISCYLKLTWVCLDLIPP